MMIKSKEIDTEMKREDGNGFIIKDTTGTKRGSTFEFEF